MTTTLGLLKIKCFFFFFCIFFVFFCLVDFYSHRIDNSVEEKEIFNYFFKINKEINEVCEGIFAFSLCYFFFFFAVHFFVFLLIV